jgi:hypothetical protein
MDDLILSQFLKPSVRAIHELPLPKVSEANHTPNQQRHNYQQNAIDNAWRPEF